MSRCEGELFSRYLKFTPLRLRDIEAVALDMGVPAKEAITARRDYLWRELDFWLDVRTDVVTWDVLCRPIAWAIIDDIKRLHVDSFWKSKPVSKNEITDEMKERARAYPVTELIQFQRGKSLAFCHTDKTPSLSYYAKGNIARCFVCAKSFGPIDVLMVRDGYKFLDAVRALQ